MNEPFFEPYVNQLRLWQAEEPNPKVQAVLNYVERKHVVADLVGAGLMYCGPGPILLTTWDSATPTPELFKMLTPKIKDKRRDQGDAFVRWRVQVSGDPVSALWEDFDVRNSWIRFVASRKAVSGLCMVTGAKSVLAESHPKRIRHPGDNAKLISSNDAAGFTFRGRISTPEQAYGVGSIATQKAHAALRWLISRQGYHDKATGQVFVAWSVKGATIPDPFLNTTYLFGDGALESNSAAASYRGDGGQHFAVRLRKALAGYRARLSDSDGIVVMGVDSATTGRMAITYYRELSGSEFLDRIAGWHSEYAWRQNYSKDHQFVGAPAPREIAETAYGRRLDDALRKATVGRLLPSIIDACPLPVDILRSVVRRVSNRNSLEKWEWEKCLGIACALVRGSRKDENYEMSLELSRTSRDYLFGRLLAIADNIEDRAQHLAKEKRDTNAAKLMQRFADHPCSTWRTIELAITPYKARLRANRPAVLLEREKLLDTVHGMFGPEDFTNDSKLSGEFLLGYHCQRAALWAKGTGNSPDVDEKQIEGDR
jgi:CRISPR-associated protein Csd1